jgi:hypothetical protein
MAMPGGLSRKRKARTEQVVPDVDAAPHPSPLLGRRVSASAGGSGGGDGGRGGGSGGVDPGPDYPIPNFDVVYSRMRNPKTGFEVADRRWRLLHYPKCFIGSEAVEWMMRNLGMNREAAIRTGQHLMDAGIVHHVTHSEPFCDKYYFFRFQEDDESCVLNMKRVWDPSLRSRPPVEVSQELLTRLACLCEKYRLRIIKQPQPPPQQQVHSGTRQPGWPSRASVHALGTHSGERPAGAPPDLQFDASGTIRVAPPSGATPLAASDAAALSSPVHVMSGAALTGLTAEWPASGANGVSAGAPAASGSADDVDYALLAKSEEFRAYALSAAELQRVQLLGLSHEERIAFFVNVYNALCLHCYVARGPPTSVFRRWVFFRMLSYRIAGLDMSLDDIEHGILRGNKRAPMIKIIQQLRPSDPKCQHVLTNRDGRIHFVISAGTASDPPIRILDGESVQEQLHDATVEFLSHSAKIDTVARTVTLPRIFMWYADDFPSPDRNLLEWVGQYLLAEPASALASIMGENDPLPTITYENFDWCASDARFNAAVVRRKRRRLERELAAAQGSLTSNASLGILNGPFDAGFSKPFDVAGVFSAATAFPMPPEAGVSPLLAFGGFCGGASPAPPKASSSSAVAGSEIDRDPAPKSSQSECQGEQPS